MPLVYTVFCILDGKVCSILLICFSTYISRRLPLTFLSPKSNDIVRVVFNPLVGSLLLLFADVDEVVHEEEKNNFPEGNK